MEELQAGDLVWDERKKCLYQVKQFFDEDIQTTTGPWLFKGHYRPVRLDEVEWIDVDGKAWPVTAMVPLEWICRVRVKRRKDDEQT